ncbi:hypothetical protein D3C85_929320 [compost metagenome]
MSSHFFEAMRAIFRHAAKALMIHAKRTDILSLYAHDLPLKFNLAMRPITGSVIANLWSAKADSNSMSFRP